MVLHQMAPNDYVVARPMTYLFPEHGYDGAGIGVMSIAGDSHRDTPGNNSCRAKEGCYCLVPLRAE